MRVHHLNCATMCPPLGKLFVNDRGVMVCHVLLVESEDGLILVDTGLGTEDVAKPRERLGGVFLGATGPRLDVAETARAQVEALGFRASDVRHVVVTHLDVDHAGGIPDFPDANVHVVAAELDAATRRATRIERERYRPVHFAHAPRWIRHEAGGDVWNGFQCVRAIDRLAGVLIVPLVGHTRGHVGVAVDTGSGWLLHAGDAYFHRDEMREPPRCSLGLRLFQRIVEMDRRARLDNQRRLRVLAASRGDVRVFSAHDPEEFDELRAVASASEPRAVAAT